MNAAPSPLDKLPPPGDIHSRMGRLYRELTLLRRLLRLVQSATAGQAPADQRPLQQEVPHAS